MSRNYFICVFLVLLAALMWGFAVCASDIEVSSFESDSIRFSFSNPRFVTYNGIYSFSIDLEAKVESAFLSRDIDFANLSLTMMDGQLSEIITVNPSLLNSTTFGTIVQLSPTGNKIDSATGISEGPIKSINVKSGNVHKGTLLFYLPDTFAMIHKVNYNTDGGDIRLSKNVYVDITENDMSISNIKNQLLATPIPTRGHMILLDIYTSIRKFTELNAPLKAAW